MFTLEGREMLCKLKGMFQRKEKTMDLATSDGSEYHLLGYSAAVVLTLTMLQSLKRLTLQ
jgi:hypothetical protein